MEQILEKVHGSENDFYLLDETKLSQPLTKNEIETIRRAFCDRATGPLGGADGVLLVQPSSHPNALAKMRVINQDGSEASMCGNGLRTVARYLAEEHRTNAFKVETMYADLQVQAAPAFAPAVPAYQVEISPVRFEAAAIPMLLGKRETLRDDYIEALSTDLRFSVVAVPNPHLLAFVENIDTWKAEQERIATYVNGPNPLFPDGINVSFIEVRGPQAIFVRTYERGVGFTNACGTAMCASSLMYCLLKGGRFEQSVAVFNPGGMVQTVVHQAAEQTYWMELIGNATVVARVSLAEADLRAGKLDKLAISYTEEATAYQEFVTTIRNKAPQA